MTARAVIVLLAVLLTHLLVALAGRWYGEADGWHAAEVHAQRCSELALGYGYRYGLYDEEGEYHCAMYGELEYDLEGWEVVR